MERFNSKDIQSMMEAYASIYNQPEVECLDESVTEAYSERGEASRASRERSEEEARVERVRQQNQVRTALGAGRGINLKGATSGVNQGTGYATTVNGKEGILVKGDSRALRSRQPINVAGRTLYPAKRGNDIVYLPSSEAPKANSLTLKPNNGGAKPNNGGAKPNNSGAKPNNSGAKPNNDSGSTALPTADPKPKLKPTGAADPRNQQYTKDRAAISTAKTPEARAAVTKKAETTGMAAWAKANPKLAAKVKPGQAGYETIQRTLNPKPAATSFNPNAPRVVPTAPRPTAGAAAVARPATPAPRPAATSFNPNAPRVVPTAPRPTAGANVYQKRQRIAASADLFDIVKGELLDEGYSEEDAMYIMANLNEEQREIVMNEGIGALLKLGAKALRSGAGKKVLSKAANLIKGGKKGKSAIAKRATKAVKDQRAGVSGTADELNLMQKDVEAVSSKLKKLKDPTRGDAVAAAGRVERDVRKANAMTPARTSSKPFGQRIDKSVSDQGKISFEVPKKSSIDRPLSYKEMMAKRSKEFAGKTEAEKREIFNQYIKRWEGRNK